LISVHAQKEKDDKDDQRKPREGHYNKPQKKNVRGKKKNTSLKKKKKGAANPIPAAAPFSLFGFSSPVSISPPSNTFHSSISTPRSCNSS
jgi:hypothetical protein